MEAKIGEGIDKERQDEMRLAGKVGPIKANL